MHKEHFVTLFDESYLPLGLALYESLCAHARPFHLWVLTMDEAAEKHLQRLALPELTPLPLHEVETPALRAIKHSRSHAEYCLTLTPFVFAPVFARAIKAARVTYLDADVYLFDDPRLLLRELEESHRQILMTEHAFGAGYDREAVAGRFCVQFLTCVRSPHAAHVLHWWQERCLEACPIPARDGKFGDQKYLDEWPVRFAEAIHIVKQTHQTLAPWNVNHFARLFAGPLRPVMYHFHAFRLLNAHRARLHRGYRVGREARQLYRTYLEAVGRAVERLHAAQIAVRPMHLPVESFRLLRKWRRVLSGEERYAQIPRHAKPPE